MEKEKILSRNREKGCRKVKQDRTEIEKKSYRKYRKSYRKAKQDKNRRDWAKILIEVT